MHRFGGIHTGVGDRHFGGLDEGGVSRLRRRVLRTPSSAHVCWLRAETPEITSPDLIPLDRRGSVSAAEAPMGAGPQTECPATQA